MLVLLRQGKERRFVVVTDYGPILIAQGPSVELYRVDEDTTVVACRRCGLHAPGGFGVTESQGHGLFHELYDAGFDHDCDGHLDEARADAWRESMEELQFDKGAA